MKAERYNLADEWCSSLSKSSKKHMKMILKRPKIVCALNKLLPFYGLWSDFQPGNWAKRLAAHSDELILNYLSYMSNTYDSMAVGLEPHFFNEVLVDALQYRVPSESVTDRQRLSEAIATSFLETDKKRVFENNVMRQNSIIPSFLTFHENMRYITIALKIVEQLLPAKKRKYGEGPISNTKNLFHLLRKYWNSTHSGLQVEEGRFISCKKISFAASVFQLFLAALRHFPYLCSQHPLQDFHATWKGCHMDERYQMKLRETAWKLGFHFNSANSMIGLSNSMLDPSPKLRIAGDWRGGLPSCSVFYALQKSLFLPELVFHQHKSEEPSITWVAWNIFVTFFGSDRDLKEFCEIAMTHEDVHMTQDVEQTTSQVAPMISLKTKNQIRLKKKKQDEERRKRRRRPVSFLPSVDNDLDMVTLDALPPKRNRAIFESDSMEESIAIRKRPTPSFERGTKKRKFHHIELQNSLKVQLEKEAESVSGKLAEEKEKKLKSLEFLVARKLLEYNTFLDEVEDSVTPSTSEQMEPFLRKVRGMPEVINETHEAAKKEAQILVDNEHEAHKQSLLEDIERTVKALSSAEDVTGEFEKWAKRTTEKSQPLVTKVSSSLQIMSNNCLGKCFDPVSRLREEFRHLQISQVKAQSSHFDILPTIISDSDSESSEWYDDIN